MALDQLRLQRLVEHLMSASVQVGVPEDVQDEPARLSQQQVAAVFIKHVPGVKNFLFRQQHGQYSLKFLQIAYKDGLRAFSGTPLHSHLLRLFRLIVHYGHEDKDGASGYLTEVAEAFKDCQAVQARTIEHVGLRICGVALDFQGLITALADDFKTWALKMLAAERLAKGLAQDGDENPTHYENRLMADLGVCLGLNAADVRRAQLDEHATARFRTVRGGDVEAAAARCRELFDADAFVRAFVNEVNSFDENSPRDSLPRLFLDWVSDNLTEQHIIFDEDTSTRLDIDCSFALSVLEVVFLGKPAAPANECFRGVQILSLFEARAHVVNVHPLPHLTAEFIAHSLPKPTAEFIDGKTESDDWSLFNLAQQSVSDFVSLFVPQAGLQQMAGRTGRRKFRSPSF